MNPKTIKQTLHTLTDKPTAERHQKEGYPDYYFYDDETGAFRFHNPDRKPSYGLRNLKSKKGDCVIYDEKGRATNYIHKGTAYGYKGSAIDDRRLDWVEGVLNNG